MDRDYDRLTDERRSRPFLGALVIAGIAFVAGLLAMGYALTHWEAAATFLKRGELAPAQPVAAPRTIQLIAPARPESSAEDQALAVRVSTLESRLDDVDARADAASGDADRAEALLVAFAARRALDRGAQLGYIEGLLRERFGGSQPQAVAAVLSAARQPITLEALRIGFEEAAPDLATKGAGEGWWAGFRRELASLIVVRKADTPSAIPADRVVRARAQLGGGNVDAALAEVARMPGRDKAAGWIAAARRYVAARAALDTIETAALLQPRNARPAREPSKPPP